MKKFSTLLALVIAFLISWDYDASTLDVLEQSADGVEWEAVSADYVRSTDGTEWQVTVTGESPVKLFRVLRLTPPE